MLLEGARGWRHLGGPETSIVWGKKMNNKEKGNPVSWFVGLPQIKWVSWQEWDHACRLSFVALAFSMLVNSATISPSLSPLQLSLRDGYVCVWGAFWDFTFSTGRLLHPAGLARSVALLRRDLCPVIMLLEEFQSGVDWGDKLLIFLIFCLSFDSGSKILGVKLISVILPYAFHSEETEEGSEISWLDFFGRGHDWQNSSVRDETVFKEHQGDFATPQD